MSESIKKLFKEGRISPMKGKYHSLKTREKMRKNHKGMTGKHPSLETKRKIGKANKNPSIETRRKISEGLKGRHLSEETRRKLSIINKGKHLSEETKEKISLVHKGRNKGLTFEKIYGIEKAKEIKRKLSESHIGLSSGKNHYLYGKHLSEETKRKKREKRLHQIFPKKDTSIEIKMQNALQKENIIFEKHKPIMGQPDIFIEPNFCIFCDGDYFHANPSIYKSEKIIIRGRTAKAMWERDDRVNQFLKEKGHIVLRFWEHEINNNINKCIEKINSTIKNS